ncbi:MAG: 3-phosphoshikimate 1-carboxyvinyltransferase, partial [bacterium]|nr:3-phosphoshikimate 1-carboxyvinyltransferase [bacterium]
HIQGRPLKGIRYRLPVASAQLKSALFLAGLFATGKTFVTEPSLSRDHTERMFRGGRRFQGRNFKIPADISSAAYFIVAGLIQPSLFPPLRVRGGAIGGGDTNKLVLKNIGINPTRTGLLDVLKKMDGRIALKNRKNWNGEPVADIEILPSRLKGTTVRGKLIPRLIDEIPILAVAAAFAQGKTTIRDAAELRVKESDRIAVLKRELSRLGVRIKERPDGLEIFGGTPLRGARVKSEGDHRIAMALAIAALFAKGKTKIQGTSCIQTSFPTFLPLLRKITS